MTQRKITVQTSHAGGKASSVPSEVPQTTSEESDVLAIQKYTTFRCVGAHVKTKK